jgi:hypothetical protein
VAAKHSIKYLNRKNENVLYLGIAFFNKMTQNDIKGCGMQTTTTTTTTSKGKLQQ